MITNSITFLIICAFAFIPLFLGEMARKKNILTAEDFILQGRKLKIFPMYATVFATWMSIFAFVGAIAYFYEKGPLYMTTVGWDALFALLFFFLGKRIWYYGKVHDYMTPTDFFNDIYDSKLLNIIVTVLVIIATMIYLQVQIVGGLLVMNIATGGTISKYVCAVIFCSHTGNISLGRRPEGRSNDGYILWRTDSLNYARVRILPAVQSRRHRDDVQFYNR